MIFCQKALWERSPFQAQIWIGPVKACKQTSYSWKHKISLTFWCQRCSRGRNLIFFSRLKLYVEAWHSSFFFAFKLKVSFLHRTNFLVPVCTFHWRDVGILTPEQATTANWLCPYFYGTELVTCRHVAAGGTGTWICPPRGLLTT